MRLNADLCVDGSEFAGRSFGFGETLAGVLFVKQELALEITGLDIVAINDSQGTDAGAS